MKTLTIDIGGTGIKMIRLDSRGEPLGKRERELTPEPATPEAVLAVIGGMLRQQAEFDRASVGFPGVVVDGVVHTAPNLGTAAWRGFELQDSIAGLAARPTRVMNDADLQGFGVIDGRGVELVFTLGTGLGTGLYVDGHLVPNLELGHHPWRDGKSYEQLVSDAEFERVGVAEWQQRVVDAIAELEPIFNYRRLHLGGGNADEITAELPANVRIFDNVEGMTGGVRLWRS
jgi:polyphosphate glucokinase